MTPRERHKIAFERFKVARCLCDEAKRQGNRYAAAVYARDCAEAFVEGCAAFTDWMEALTI